MTETTCAICHRVVYDVHLDGEGRCCYCATPPAQESSVARPTADSRVRPSPVPPPRGQV